MKTNPTALITAQSNHHLLMAYIADLELEVDRLHKHGQFIQQQVRESLKRIQTLSIDPTASNGTSRSLAEIGETVKELASVLRDLQELPSYHPAHDQVTAMALRPLLQQVFRWQQRLESARNVSLHLELESEHVEWFPARLRHILDNLISNALKYRDVDSKESWVRARLRVSSDSYEFTIADNGIGLPLRERTDLFGLFYRAAPAHPVGHGVGLAVVKLLVEQSGGTLTAESTEDLGTAVTVVLPRYEVDDFLT